MYVKTDRIQWAYLFRSHETCEFEDILEKELPLIDSTIKQISIVSIIKIVITKINTIKF